MALLSNSEFVLDEKNRRNVSKYFITYYDKGSVLLDRTFHREQTLNFDQHIYTPPTLPFYSIQLKTNIFFNDAK